MGATEEQMALVESSGLDHVAYILIIYSLAFLLFLFVNVLVTVYYRNSTLDFPIKDTENGRLGPRVNGNVPIRDAQEFELEGLMSDDEDDDARPREDDDLNSPSTIGKNSDGVAR